MIKHPSVPPYPCDIQPNDYIDQNYQAPSNGTFGMGPGESFYRPSLNEVQANILLSLLPREHSKNLSDVYYPPHPEPAPILIPDRVVYNGGLPSTFQTYNTLSHFQTQPSFTTVLDPISGSLASLQGALTPLPASLRKKVQKASQKLKQNGKRTTRNATQSSKEELLKSKRTGKRGPNKKRSSISFSYLLDNLSQEVRNSLEVEYKGCCDSINSKDVSVKQKHWFTQRHCLNLPKEHQEAVPNFVCPAFLALNSKCRAKAGRYDSAERHCQNCAGLQEISSGKTRPRPVAITRSAYNGVQEARLALIKNKGNGEATKLMVEAARNMLAELLKHGQSVIDHDEGEYNGGSEAILDHLPTAQPPTMSEPVFEGESVEDWVLGALPVIDHEGESSSFGAIEDYAAQPTAQPPTTSEPVYEAESPEDWVLDALRAIEHEGEPSSFGAIENYAAQPAAQPPTMSEEPVFEAESVEDWVLDALPAIDQEGESSSFGAIEDYAAQPPTTSAGPVFEAENVNEWNFYLLNWQASGSNVSGGIVDSLHTTATLEPVLEPEIVEWGLNNALQPINVSGCVMVEQAAQPTAQQPATSEPEPEPEREMSTLQEWVFDSATFQVCKSDFHSEMLDPPYEHTPYYTPPHRTGTNTPPFAATLEPVLE